MTRYENAPAEQTQNLSKNFKMRTLEKDFEDILAATSEYYGEALGKLANGEVPDENKNSNNSSC